MRKLDIMEIMLAVLTGLVVLAIVATVLALAYPDTTASIVRDIRQQVSEGKSPLFAFFGELGRRASDGFSYRVRPFLKNSLAWVSNKFAPEKEGKKAPPPAPDFAAKDCAECHDGFFEVRAQNNIYVDHRLHEAEGVSCNTCHTGIKHPKPARVTEETCLKCHRTRRASTACADCHPPGSILDKTVISQAKTDEFLAGRTSANKSLTRSEFAAPNREWLEAEHGVEAPCRSCHRVPDFCNTCHFVFHNELPDWRNTHGPRLLKKVYTQNACWTCHNPNWCSDTCHASVPGRQRRGGFKEPPVTPLERLVR